MARLEQIAFCGDAAAVRPSEMLENQPSWPRARPVSCRLVLLLCTLFGGLEAGFGCGPAALPPGARISRELILSHDDNRGSAVLTFPTLTYESIVRFELPPGKRRALRLRFMAQAAGTVAITFYENSVLECPGTEIRIITRDLAKEDVSDGKDGRWVVEDLRELPPLEGVVWVGIRKIGGDPSLWTSATVSGQVYLRDRDPGHGVGLLPVKRTPMVRMEMLP